MRAVKDGLAAPWGREEGVGSKKWNQGAFDADEDLPGCPIRRGAERAWRELFL